jgi:hypothetical protein
MFKSPLLQHASEKAALIVCGWLQHFRQRILHP